MYLWLIVQLPNPETSQFVMFCLFMMVFPYGMVGLFAWYMRHAHSITHLFVIATCFMQTMLELTFLSSCVTRRNWRYFFHLKICHLC
jgi:hypothetical protein